MRFQKCAISVNPWICVKGPLVKCLWLSGLRFPVDLRYHSPVIQCFYIQSVSVWWNQECLNQSKTDGKINESQFRSKIRSSLRPGPVLVTTRWSEGPFCFQCSAAPGWKLSSGSWAPPLPAVQRVKVEEEPRLPHTDRLTSVQEHLGTNCLDPKLPGFSLEANNRNVSKSEKLYWFSAVDKIKYVDSIKPKIRGTRFLTSCLGANKHCQQVVLSKSWTTTISTCLDPSYYYYFILFFSKEVTASYFFLIFFCF